MMYPRLRLARNLLDNKGVIFISIDDNELAGLIKICDEVFGDSNFVGCISRATGTTTGQDANKIGSSLDYCVVYSKSDTFTLNGIEMDEKDMKRFSEFDSKGRYSTLQLRKTGNADRKSDRPNMFYPVQAPDGSEVYPFGPGDYLSRWRVSRDSYEKLVKEDMIVWKQNNHMNLPNIEGYQKSSWIPYVKYYLEGRTKQVSNLFQDIEGNKKASIVLKELLGSKGVFDNPKPVGFMTRLIQISTDKDSIILDFFSGSATTAHAVMQLNAEDGGDRRFIMVQLPEVCGEKTEAYKAGYKNICEIGKERIRRAGEKIKAEIEEENAQLKMGEKSKKVPDIGFSVFKLDSSNLKKWQPDYDDLEKTLLDSIENYVEGRSELDVVYEIILKMGLDLTYPVDELDVNGRKIYSVAFGALMICLDDHITKEIADGMISLYQEYQPELWKVVFKDNGFENDSAKTNIKEQLKAAGLEEDAFTTI